MTHCDGTLGRGGVGGLGKGGVGLFGDGVGEPVFIPVKQQTKTTATTLDKVSLA